MAEEDEDCVVGCDNDGGDENGQNDCNAGAIMVMHRVVSYDAYGHVDVHDRRFDHGGVNVCVCGHAHGHGNGDA